MRKPRELNPDSSCQKTMMPTATESDRSAAKGDEGKMKNYLKQIIIIVFSSIILGCAASGDSYESAGDPVETRGNDCFLQSSIRDYQALDDSNLIVTGSGNRTYHVELISRAYGLRSSWSIGFRSPTGMVCSGGSSVVFNDGFGTQGSSVRVRSIRQINSDEREALLVRFRKKKPEEEQQAPAEEEPEGAEVEELG
jgi:hypothetical protein